MQLLLIDSRVPDFQVFVDSVNEKTTPIVYSDEPSFTGTVERIGIVFILGRNQFFGPENETKIVNLIRDHGIKQIDFLACNTLQDPLWTSYYERLTEQTGVIIGASNDLTGNLKYGGNWIMESTSQDIEQVYFTKSIEYYKYLLDFFDIPPFNPDPPDPPYYPPGITSISPLNGTKDTLLTIYGGFLDKIIAVYIGGIQLSSYDILSSSEIRCVIPLIPLYVSSTGILSVSVYDGTTQAEYSGNFIYSNPTINSFTPLFSPSLTSIVIEGDYLQNTSYITFGNTSRSESFSIVDGILNCSVPIGTGTVPISVTDIYGNTGFSQTEFAYTNPSINSFTPQSAPSRSSIVIEGDYFQNTSYITFGNASKSESFTKTDDSINCSVPVGTGEVQLIVTDIYGNNSISPSLFTYTNPKINNIIPDSAPSNSFIDLVGVHLQNTSYVTFGNASKSDFSKENDEKIKCLVPNGTGNVEVVITDIYDNTTKGNFTYANPKLNNINPNHAKPQSYILLEGNHLEYTSYITFGNASISEDFSVANGSIKCLVPNGTGNVEVVVTDLYDNTTKGNFTYENPPTITTVPPAPSRSSLILNGEYLENISYITFGNVSRSNPIFIEGFLNCSVPIGTGTVPLNITDIYGITTSSQLFTYQNLNLSSIVPNSAPSRSSVILQGNYLEGTSYITFGNASRSESFFIVDGIANCSVPVGTGNVTVFTTDDYGNNSNGLNFTYTNPTILNITPNHAVPLSSILLEGNHLENTSYITFGNISRSESFFIVDGNVNCSVPIGTGNVSVFTTDIYGNIANSPTLFTYDITTSPAEQARLNATQTQTIYDEIGVLIEEIDRLLGVISIVQTDSEPFLSINYTKMKDDAIAAKEAARVAANKWKADTEIQTLADTASLKSSQTTTSVSKINTAISSLNNSIINANAEGVIADGAYTDALNANDDASDAATALETGEYQDIQLEISKSAQALLTVQTAKITIETAISNISSAEQNLNDVFYIIQTEDPIATEAQLAASEASDEALLKSDINLRNNPELFNCIIPIIDASNNLYTVGDNVLGQAGMGNVDSQTILTFNTSNVTAAGTTRNGMMYLKNSSIYYSGENQYGELGTTTTITSTLNNNLSNITQFSAGLDHSLFVDNTNTVFASGLNTYGQLGIGTILNSSTPSLLNVSGIQVATGREHSALLAPNGDAYTFGRNNYGQLGNNTQIKSSTPVLVKSNVTTIACGSNHTLFLSQDNVYACGINTSGQLGVASTTPWVPTLIPTLTNVVSISSGGDNSAALDRVGNLWVWGTNYDSTPTILKTQVTYVNVTLMGLFYVSDKKYYALNTLFIPDGVITYNNTPLFRIISNICFPADTPVTTDQGDIPIVEIQPNHHTIRGKRIVAITETYSSEKELIVIEKDALLPNCPSQRTMMTKEHKIFYNGQMIESYKFLNHEGVSSIPYEQQPLYNVLLEDPGRMKVNNMIVETLDPTNMIGKLFKEYQESLTN